MINVRALALDNIQKKHDTNKRLTQLMLDNAFAHSDVDKLYKRCRAIQLDIAKLEFAGKSTSTLTHKLNDSKKELYALLDKYNIDRESLKVKYNCEHCHDTGFVNGQDCDCLKAEISSILLELSGINKNNLPNFDEVYFKIFGDNEQEVRKIYTTLQNYVNAPSVTKQVVTISGSVGVGKTHLLECMVNDSLKQNKYVIYVTAAALNNDMLKYHTSPMDEKEQYLQKYFDCDILFVDDLGTESILKNVTNEYLYQIINERTRANKPTVITTNLELQQIIDVYDERVFSRIANQKNCLLIKMKGKDLRIQK